MPVQKIVMEKFRNIFIGIFLVFFAQLTLPILFEWKINLNFWYLVIAIVVYFTVVDFQNPEKLARNAFFLILSFGTVIALIRPVQYALDEESHLENAIGISDSFLFKYSQEELKDYDSVFLHDGIRNQANYKGDEYWYNVEHQESIVSGKPKSFDNPAFIPGAIGWNIGRLISDKVYVSYYLGRICHVLAFALLVFLALRVSKVYQELIYLMGTLPSALYVVSGFHYDYLYYGASLLLLAMLTNVLANKEKITVSYSIRYQAIVLLFAFSKFPLVLAGSMILALPLKYYVSKKEKLFTFGMFGVTFLLALMYVGIIKIFDVEGSVTAGSPGILYFILHPLPIVRTLIDAPVVILDNFVSRPLQYVSHQSALLNILTMVSFLFSMIVITLRTNIKVPRLFKYFSLMLLLGVSLLIIFAITGDNRVYQIGNIMVGGVQGRYYYLMMCFIPLFLGDWLKKSTSLIVKSDENEEQRKFLHLLQYMNSFLVIFAVSVGFYMQI
ncbi:TPA: DUF2142 domain-containing protein [Streptococcus suis]